MSSPRFPPVAGLLVGITAASTAAIFIRQAQTAIPSLAVAAWRLALASLLLAPFALATRRAEWRQLTRQEWLLALVSGVMLALHFAAWISSLALTTVAASVSLVATSPLFIGVLSHFVLKERLTHQMLIGLPLALVGTVVVAWGDAGQGTHRLTGDLLALLGAVGAAGYFLIGRRLRGRLSLLAYIFPVYGTAAVVLMALAAFSGAPLGGYGGSTWLWLLLLALIPQIVGHSSLNWALAYLPATYVAVVTLGEPIGSSTLAWLLLHEPPTVVTVAGAALILGGIVVATRTSA